MSAIFAIGALEPWASSTRRMIWERTVSAPTFVTRKVMAPFLFMLAPIRESPGPFSTGKLSPVSMDSSTAVVPETIVPSTGIFSPGLTRTMSPASTSSIGISISLPSWTTVAVLGWRPMSFLIDSEVRPFDTASRDFPSRIRVMMIPAVSK